VQPEKSQEGYPRKEFDFSSSVDSDGNPEWIYLFGLDSGGQKIIL